MPTITSERLLQVFFDVKFLHYMVTQGVSLRLLVLVKQ